MKLAVLASGTGTLFDAMLRNNVPVHLLLADRSCPAVGIAARAGVDSCVLERQFGDDFDREAYTLRVADLLQSEGIELIAMAGFMTVFSPEMFQPDRYQMRVINSHPSLLPAFKGAHAVRDALAAKVKKTGCTLHWATDELDEGPIIVQESVPVLPGDTVESLHERIKAMERILYPQVLLSLM